MNTYHFVSSKDLCKEFRKVIGDAIYYLYDDDGMTDDFIFLSFFFVGDDFIFHDEAFGE